MKVFQAFVYINVGAGALFFVIWFFTSVPLFQQTAFAEESSGDTADLNNAPSAGNAVVTAEAPSAEAPSAEAPSAKAPSAEAPSAEAPSAEAPSAEAPSADVSPEVKKSEVSSVSSSALSSSEGSVKKAEEPIPKASEGSVKKAEAVPTQPIPKASEGSVKKAEAVPTQPIPKASEGSVKKAEIEPLAPAPNNKTAQSNQAGAPQPVHRKGASVTTKVAPPPPPPLPVSEEESASPQPSVSDNDIAGKVNEKGSAELNKLLESADRLKSNQTAGASAADDVIKINRRIADIYKVLNSYHYDSNNRRDPFKAFDVPSDEDSMDSGKTAPIPTYPTGQYNLSEIKLVGIKWNSKIGPSKALFKTPDNTLHYLQKNDRIGSNWGVIYRLKEDEVVILEPKKGSADNKESSYVPIIVRLDRWKNKNKGKGQNMEPSLNKSKPLKGA